MRKILYSCFLVLAFLSSRGQYVLIPDTAFGNLLHTGYPSCIIGSSASAWIMDTSCLPIQSCTDLQIYTTSIRSLQGVQYLRNLKSLNFTNNGVSHLPALPPNLQTLNCSLNYLDSLPALPNSLVNLNCEVCNLYHLPTLPSSLRYLECQDNHLANLPTLPDTLSFFDCSDNINLQCLPHLGVIGSINITSTSISCLPDTPSGGTYTIPSNIPVCAAPCNVAEGVSYIPENNVSILLYPNPASDKLYCNLNLENNNIILLDVMGRHLPLSISNSEIDVSALPLGIYYLSFKNNEQRIIKKFVKE